MRAAASTLFWPPVWTPSPGRASPLATKLSGSTVRSGADGQALHPRQPFLRITSRSFSQAGAAQRGTQRGRRQSAGGPQEGHFDDLPCRNTGDCDRSFGNGGARGMFPPGRVSGCGWHSTPTSMSRRSLPGCGNEEKIVHLPRFEDMLRNEITWLRCQCRETLYFEVWGFRAPSCLKRRGTCFCAFFKRSSRERRRPAS